MIILSIERLEKGKRRIKLDDGSKLLMYYKDIEQYNLAEGESLLPEVYNDIVENLLGKRATKRAMHILERQDKTEKQLRDKLKENEYPERAIDIAIDYVKGYRYIDDERYAASYIRYRQESKSRQKLKQELMMKGINSAIIDKCIDEEYDADEMQQIMKLLEKKHYNNEDNDPKEKRRIYAFLARKGFANDMILKAMG